MPKTGSEKCRNYRLRKNANKFKKIPKSSTERVREFRARRKMLFSKVNDNVSVVLNNHLDHKKIYQQVPETVKENLRQIPTKVEITSSMEKPEEPSLQQREREYSPLLLNDQIKQENEEFILDIDGPPSPVNEPWDYYGNDIKQQHSPFVRNEPLILDNEDFLEITPHSSANCNQTELQIEPSPIEQKTKYHCNECVRNFNSYNALKYHQRTHSEQRSYKCATCESSFYTQSALNVHEKKHSNVKPFKCDQCDHRCRQLGHLQSHILSRHTEVKAFTCEFCGKDFARRYSLVLHRRIHTSERDYACEYCNRTFRTRSYLISHLKIHTGERPYKCSICDKAFSISGNLKRHLRIHEPARKDDVETYTNNNNTKNIIYSELEQEILGF